MLPKVNITKIKVFDVPGELEHGNKSLAWFNFEYAGIQFNTNFLRLAPDGTPRADLHRPQARTTRPFIFRDPKVAMAVTNAAVSAYFAAGGLFIDQVSIEALGFSNRIGLDGFPLDPRHPFGRENAA